MLTAKNVQAVRPVQASRRAAVRPVAQAKAPQAKAQLAAAAAVVALSAAHPVRLPSSTGHTGV